MASQPQPRRIAPLRAGFPRALGAQYTLVGELAQGGMAEVFLALAGGIGARRVCAIKTVRYLPGDRDAELLSKRFLEEAGAVMRLAHENLVYVFDAGLVERQLYLAMEFLEGKSVADVLARSQCAEALPPELALHVAMQTLQGLAHAHQHGLVHRDVTPSNIMVSSAGAVKLLDFGLARQIDDTRQTGLSLKLGKPGYVAPEHLYGAPTDHRADLFSVAVVLWELLAGRRLFGEGRPRSWAFVSPSRYGGPAELDDSLRIALSEDPLDRFSSADEFAQELSRFVAPADHRKALTAWLGVAFGAQIALDRHQREALVDAARFATPEDTVDVSAAGPMNRPADYVGTLLGGRYRLQRLLATGSMGAVYEGEHEGIGRKVAVKIPFLQGSPELKARFVREARATNKIDDPHVVQITDAGETPQGDAFVVMDLLEGRTLEALNAEKGCWSPEEAVAIAVQIARGLEAAHEAGIVHRDLKPSNVMVLEGRQGTLVKILDFGVAKLMQPEANLPIDGLTRPETALGTPSYMAPEQVVEGRAVDPRADIYSAAVILYEMLEGRLPHEASDTPTLCWAKAHTPPAALVAPGTSPVLRSLVMEALAIDPGARPSSSSVWRSRLEALRPERRRTTTLPVAAAQEPRRKQGGRVGLLLGLAGLAVSGSWWARGGAGADRPQPRATVLPPAAPASAPPEVLAVPSAAPVAGPSAIGPEVASPSRPSPVPAPEKPPAVREAPDVQAAVTSPHEAPKAAAPLLDAAERALLVGDYIQANRWALEAVAAGKSARAYGLLARVHLAQEEAQAARAVVEEGLSRYPSDRLLLKLSERLK